MVTRPFPPALEIEMQLMTASHRCESSSCNELAKYLWDCVASICPRTCELLQL